MIVYDLIINSARHAFLADEGEIRVELLRAGAFVKCSVSDNGSGVATAPGRGLKIVEELTRSLGGRFQQRLGPRGSQSILAFPCEGEIRRNGDAIVTRSSFRKAQRKRWMTARAPRPS
jgi:two-component sensor histidine kinase